MNAHKTMLVTGGAGFIGSTFVLAQVARGHRVINLDALTYAGNLDNLATLETNPGHVFVRGSIGDAALVDELLRSHRPSAIIHFAAESHVDRSIHDATAFVETNVVGTQRLLDAALRYWRGLPHDEAAAFRFVNVSTDEVYGSLEPGDPPFSESSPLRPNSPYAASKAAGDHFARASFRTHGLPVITTHCSNNYGPFQFPEKLIPLMILNAVDRRPLPVYGDGHNVRDWLYVEDHCAAIERVLRLGRPGETYDIAGRAELTNLEVVTHICDLVDALVPDVGPSRRGLIRHATDRPGHDRRYAIDDAKIRTELGWAPIGDFASGLARTVRWYLEHPVWVARVRDGAYRTWLQTHYGAAPEARP